jgi:hypothetical protein
MRIGIELLLALALLGGAALADTPPGEVSAGSIMRQESNLATLPTLRDWTAHLQSSDDPTGGNADSGHYVAQAGQTATLADLTGPGAVVRFWSANPHGQLKIYIDDAPVPVVDTPLATFFAGTSPPFTSPLVASSTGGFVSYVPIPYAHHCRITVDDPGNLYYQIGYDTYPAATAVRSFALPLTADDQAAEAQMAAAWSSPAWPAAPAAKTVTVRQGRTQTLDRFRGPGVVTLVQADVPDADDAALRRLILRAYFDGHKAPDIEAPLSDFFGNAYGRDPGFTSLLVRQDNGTFAACFPMPFGKSARFTLENGNTIPISLTWSALVQKQAFDLQTTGYFHARWRQEFTQRGVPHIWAQLQGQRGQFLGVVQTMAGPHGVGFLEGDDQFRVDNEKWLPSMVKTTVIGPWNGTGTEDFFNSGWYFNGGLNALPLNGVRVRDDAGRINAYRWMLDDAPVFQSSLDAQIEHDGQNDAPGVYYSSVAYWYSNGPVSGWPAMPRASQMALPGPPPPSFLIPHVIEGEGLVSGSHATGGHVQTQDMTPWPGKFSGDAQLWWSGAKQGDTLTIPVTPPAAGTYTVTGYFTKAIDYGQVSFTLAGQSLTPTLDAFHNGVIPSGPVPLGRITLPAGPSPLVVTLTGKNPASQGYLFGLDALALKSLAAGP